MGGQHVTALVDSGCTTTMLSAHSAQQLSVGSTASKCCLVTMLDRRSASATRGGPVMVKVAGRGVPVRLATCLVVDKLLLGYAVVSGQDFIHAAGGVTLRGSDVELCGAGRLGAVAQAVVGAAGGA